MIKKTVVVIFPLMFMVLISILEAQVDQVTLRVDGLACPFCAYGVEKKLKKLEGTSSMNILINEGKIILGWRPDRALDLEAIRKAVDMAGFTLRGVKATVRGALMSDAGKFYLLAPHTPGQRFYLYESSKVSNPSFAKGESLDFLTEDTRNRLQQLLRKASVVRIVGPLHEENHLERRIGLGIEILEEISF